METLQIVFESIAALFRGDYDGGLHVIGIDEDHPLLSTLFSSSSS